MANVREERGMKMRLEQCANLRFNTYSKRVRMNIMTDYNVGSQLDADARPRVVHPVVGVEHNSQTERIYHSYKGSGTERLRLRLEDVVFRGIENMTWQNDGDCAVATLPFPRKRRILGEIRGKPTRR